MSEQFSEKRKVALQGLAAYLAKAGDSQRLHKLLLDFNFIASKCANGMQYGMLEDLERAMALQVSVAVAQMRQAYALALPLISERPELTAQLLYNQLNWIDGMGPDIAGSLSQMRKALDAGEPWLQADAPLPRTNTTTTGHFSLGTGALFQSVALSTIPGPMLAATTVTGDATIYDIQSGAVRTRRRLNAASLIAIALSDDGTSLAYADHNGVIRIDQSTSSLLGRPNETCLLHPSTHEVIGVRNDHSLVYWHQSLGTADVLVSNLPAPLITLRSTPDGRSILFIAGHTKQRLGWIARQKEGWLINELPYQGPPIRCADIDASGRYILLASLDRRLHLYSVLSNEVIAQLFYEQVKDISIRGQPALCALEAEGTGSQAFIATLSGDIASWNWSTNEFTRLESYRGPSEAGRLMLFQWLPLSGQLFCSTETTARLLSSRLPARLSPRHSAQVTQCVITALDEIVSVSERDRTIRWWTRRGLQPLAVQAQPVPPSALASCDTAEHVVVGDQQGGVWLQDRSGAHQSADVIASMTEPVLSLFYAGSNCPVGGKMCAFATGRAGKVLAVDLDGRRQGVLWHPTAYRTQLKILPAVMPALFWSIYNVERGTAQGFDTMIALVDAIDHERRIYNTPYLVHDVAVTSSGAYIGVASRTTQVLARYNKDWQLCFERPVVVSHIAFLDDSLLVVILRDESWLEIWRLEEGLPTLAATDVPAQVECLTTRGRSIVVGLRSGDLMSISLCSGGQ